MNPAELVGHVVVVAGEEPLLRDVADLLVEAGAFVAFVSTTHRCPGAQADVRAAATDADAWTRIAAHVEQRLGPVDAVVVETAAADTVAAVFAADLRARGHGDVVTAAPGDDVVDVVNRLVRTL